MIRACFTSLNDLFEYEASLISNRSITPFISCIFLVNISITSSVLKTFTFFSVISLTSLPLKIYFVSF
nr:MAG TPA: hypothetical protein [Caudoviricetes sp.]